MLERGLMKPAPFPTGGIIAQRLARRLCESCKRPASIPEPALLEEGFTKEQLEKSTLYEANPDGCPKCNRGYKGRVGIYEMLPMSSEIADVIMNNGNSHDITRVALTQGFRTLRMSGLIKVAKGITSLEEMNRVIVI